MKCDVQEEERRVEVRGRGHVSSARCLPAMCPKTSKPDTSDGKYAHYQATNIQQGAYQRGISPLIP